MEQPPGFVNLDTPNHVCLLKKSIYRLKQVSHAWFDRLSTFLLHLGFLCNTVDSSLFILKTSSVATLILIYVEDILVTSNNDIFITNLVQQLRREFAIKDLGTLHYFLGIEFICFKDGLLLTLQKYINDLLSKTKMLGCKAMATTQEKPSSSDNIIVDVSEFRSIVGALQYLTFTRPYITHAVNHACQHFTKLTVTDLKAVKRILRYLKGTQNWGLRYIYNIYPSLYGFSHADRASCPITRGSTTCYCVFLGANCISWSSKKQFVVVCSSTKVEYPSMAHTGVELTWITYLFHDTCSSLPHAPQLFCDPMFHVCKEHIELDYHFVRQKVAIRGIVTRYISTSSQLVNVFTKPLANDFFSQISQQVRRVSKSTCQLKGA
uniref:Uncharacterized protein LOC113784324 n=1 Tax=Cicer arietinum TaxID=3827 RepID=A0A3Q7WX38_CICAR|nr:uncharacterized protein LOC113784324 [Cicer arietinum]